MRYLLIGIVALLFSSVIKAQDARSFTLEEAMEYAVQNHANIKAAQLDIADAEYQIKETTSVGIPQINGELGLSRYLQLPRSVLDASFFEPSIPEGTIYTEFPQGVKNSLYGKLDLSQLLFDYSYLVGLEAAKKLKSLTRKQIALTEQQIRLNVREAYLPNLILVINEETLEKNLTNLDKMRFETQAMYDNGFVEQLDIDRLDLSISNLKIQLKTLRDQKAVLENVLKFQMDFPLEEEIIIADDIDKLLESVDDVDLDNEDIFANRAEFALFKERVEINEISQRRIKAGYFPSAFGFASYQQTMNRDQLFKAPRRVDNSKIGFVPAFLIGIQLNVPIFDGFQKKNAYQRGIIAIEKIKFEEDQLKKALTLQVKNAKVNYVVAKENLVITQENLDLAQKIYNTAKIKYKEGVGSSLEINQAEQALYSAQSNHFRSLYDLLVAKANLDNALAN